MPTLHLTGDPAADALLSVKPFALLTRALLDQQMTITTMGTCGSALSGSGKR